MEALVSGFAHDIKISYDEALDGIVHLSIDPELREIFYVRMYCMRIILFLFEVQLLTCVKVRGMSSR